MNCDNVVEDDVVDVPTAADVDEFPEVVGNGVAAADGPIGMMAGATACCLVVVVGVHEYVDPDAEEASGMDIIG